MADSPDTRTPAQIKADIERRRAQLAETLEEIGVRMHPRTMVDDAKAKARSQVDQTLGRAYVSVNRTMTEVRGRFVDEEGSPRMNRIVPVALVAVGVVGLLVLSGTRSSGGSHGRRCRRRR